MQDYEGDILSVTQRGWSDRFKPLPLYGGGGLHYGWGYYPLWATS